MPTPTRAPNSSGASHETHTGAPPTTSRPLMMASRPTSEPTEMSMLPVTITIAMPTAITAM